MGRSLMIVYSDNKHLCVVVLSWWDKMYSTNNLFFLWSLYILHWNMNITWANDSKNYDKDCITILKRNNFSDLESKINIGTLTHFKVMVFKTQVY